MPSRIPAAPRRLLPLLGGLMLMNALLPPQALAQNHAGFAAATLPDYEGARSNRTLVVPLIKYETRNFFVSPRAGLPAAGFHWSPGTGLSTGVFASIGLGRDADDAAVLHGLEDLDTHAVYGGFLAWEAGRLSTGVTWRRAAKHGYGSMADLRVSWRVLQSSRNLVTVGTNAEWADRDYMQTWFGISSEQAALSEAGLRTHQASSGLKSVAASANWAHRIDGSHWMVAGTVGINTLHGDARSSPVVERRNAPFASIGLTRTF